MDRIIEQEVEVPVEKIIEVPVEEIIEVPVVIIVEKPVFVEKRVIRDKYIHVNKKNNKNVITVEEDDPELMKQVESSETDIIQLKKEIARLKAEIEDAQNIEVNTNTKATINYEVQNDTLKNKIHELREAIESAKKGDLSLIHI